MRPVLLATAAMIIYAIQNVLLEQKLAKYSVFSLLTYFYLMMLPLTAGGWIYLKLTNQPTPSPSGWAIVLAMMTGMAYFLADSCYVGAYTNGGDIFTIAAIVVMFPALASAVRYFWVGGLPNVYQVAGYLFAALAVLLVAKGNTISVPK